MINKFYRQTSKHVANKLKHHVLSGDEKQFRHFHLDRMRNVEDLEDKFVKESIDVADYMYKTFHMF